MPRDMNSMKICMIAGEDSGDLLGARLMAGLKNETGSEIIFCGVGGPQMEAEGLQSLFPMKDLSVMGVFEVLPRLPKILFRIKQTAGFIAQEKPDLLVTVDSPDFCFRVAQVLHKKVNNLPKMVHYVAPTVWAWRSERAKKVAGLYDGIMCLYPFEPFYFQNEGMEAAFVGHPVLENGFDKVNGAALKKELEIESGAKTLGILFGSRIGELNRIGPVLRDATEQYVRENNIEHIIAPTFPHLKPQVQNFLQGLSCKRHVIVDAERKWDCFASMDSAMATSGTVGLELAVAGVPHVIAYKMNPLTYRSVKSKIKVKYAHLVNILLDKLVVPEFIQYDCKGERIARALASLDVEAQKHSFAQARKMLGGDAQEAPSKQAAKFLQRCLSRESGNLDLMISNK